MNLLKKISGSFLLGLAVIGLALGTSAFTEKQSTTENNNAFAPTFLVNKGAQYEPRATVNPIQNCQTSDPQLCVFEVTSSGSSNIPDQPAYTPAEMQDYENQGWITPHADADEALYSN